MHSIFILCVYLQKTKIVLSMSCTISLTVMMPIECSHSQAHGFDEADSGTPIASTPTHGAVRPNHQPKPKDQPQTRYIPEVKTWSKAQVQGWLRASDIQTSNERLEELNGTYLVKLYNILCRAPEYCATSLKTEFGLGLLDVATFVDALKELFE